jgi:hypothetical protein
MKRLLGLGAILLSGYLAACATGWSRPHTTEAEFDRDRLQCEQDGATRYPVRMEVFGGQQAPSRSNCTSFGLHLNCRAAAGGNVAPYQHDANENARRSDIRACLQSKGYVSKPVYGPSHPAPQHVPEREEFIG